MKNILINTVTIIVLTGFLTGCISEAFPEGDIQTAKQVAESESALSAMINAIPVNMVATDFSGYYKKYEVHTDFGIPAIHIMTESMLEDLATMGDNPYYNRFYGSLMGEALGSRFIICAYYWTCYYKWIKSVNDLIAVIDPDKATPEQLVYLGTAYAYRAYYYLDMSRMFEAKMPGVTYEGYDVSNVLGLTVPIVTEKVKEADSRNNPRATHDEMYKFILSDLDQAAKYLVDVKSGYTSPTISAVNGLYARAYLEMGAFSDSKDYYAKAEEYAKKVIDESGKTPLNQEQWEDPVNGFNNGASNNSWIWGLTLSSQVTGNLTTFSAHLASEATWGYAPLSQIGINKALYEKIPNEDFRKHSWLDPEREKFYKYKYAGKDEDKQKFIKGTKSYPPAKDYQTIKFRPAKGECNDHAVGGCADHVLMRIEEMYFIEAEALAQQGKVADACKVLQDLIKTRNPNYSVSLSTKELFLDEMLLQKRIEFWGEGILFFDYKRLGAGITRGYPGTNHPSVYCYNSKGRNPQWNFVITRGEFQSNKGITDKTNNPDPSGLLEQWTE